MAEQQEDPDWRSEAVPFTHDEVREFQEMFAAFDTLYGDPDVEWPDEVGAAT